MFDGRSHPIRAAGAVIAVGASAGMALFRLPGATAVTREGRLKQNFHATVALLAAVTAAGGGVFIVAELSPLGWGLTQLAVLGYLVVLAGAALSAALGLAPWAYERLEL